MKIKLSKAIIILFLFIFPVLLHGQQQVVDTIKHFGTSTKLSMFIDNTEFGASSYTFDQIMATVSLAQTLKWQFNSNHTIEGGVNLQRGLGSERIIDKTNFLAFYQYRDDKTLFKAGSFLWDDLLNDYNSFFFQDSVRFYKNTIDGLFLKREMKDGYFKVWLDWTGMQSPTRREQFFIGFSGFYAFSKHLYIDLQSYLEHLANVRPRNWAYYVYDNILAQSTIGYHNQIGKCKYWIAGGILAGFERYRWYVGDYYFPIGAVGKLDVTYKNFGTTNLIYAGQERMKFYDQQGGRLYYGNPFLQGNLYWENKLFWRPFETDKVKSELALKTHLSEQRIYFEQLFTLMISL